MKKYIVLFSIVGFLVSCKPNQPEKNAENVTEVPADSSTTTFVETTNDVKNDVYSQFNRLRLALASQNPKLITTFFDFPLTDNQAIGLEEVLKFTTTSKIVGDITLQKDFENNIANLFDKKVIKALGEISIEELKEKNVAQSKIFHLPNDNADYSVYVYTDEAEGNLDISVNATYPPSEDNEDALESAAIYNFKKDSNDKLKFKQVLMAG
ncbi:MAG: hypothetical protein H6553_07515 [Chitinophagales bacterium]|nr:hypothetical protein [Chitinophagales bacterium]